MSFILRYFEINEGAGDAERDEKRILGPVIEESQLKIFLVN